jgi:exosortase
MDRWLRARRCCAGEPASPRSGGGQPGRLLPGVLFAGAVLWAYWPTLVSLCRRWEEEPHYSHGFLVPLLALGLLWSRRQKYCEKSGPGSAWGLAGLVLALGLRLTAAWLYLEFLEGYSLLVTLGSLVLLLGGWAAWRWSWPALAYLAFMLPLPFQVDTALAHPLRRIATVASTYALQTLGVPAFAEGNVIYLPGKQLGVADACSGLGMLLTFFALATALAVVLPRPGLDRLILLLSALPIAIVSNVVRITASGLAYFWGYATAGQLLWHDLAGWLMMPVALALWGLELWFLKHLFLPAEAPDPLPLFLPSPGNDGSASVSPGPYSVSLTTTAPSPANEEKRN